MGLADMLHRHWILLLCLAPILVGCGQTEQSKRASGKGSPERGQQLVESHGCGACHLIPGIPDATGLVGPPLDKIARRAYLAGVLPNTFDTMVLWIAEPQKVSPRTAMPHVGLSENEAKDVTAYLFTLK